MSSTTIHLLFSLSFCGLCFGVIAWASREMTKARWQILASLPIEIESDGDWRGVNFTWYGALSGIAFASACALLLILTGATGIPSLLVIELSALITLISLLASRIVAQWVEKTPGTHTVGGALFAIILVLPLLIIVCHFGSHYLGMTDHLYREQVLALMAALSIMFVFGEGIGRIACISFGCCWGTPLDKLSHRTRRLFKNWSFVFEGSTKKIAYASNLDGVRVVPIQAITAHIHVALSGMALFIFLQGHFVTSLVLCMVGSQLWRFCSEFLRADFRGFGKISAYQWMALATAMIVPVQAFMLAQLFPAAPFDSPTIRPKLEQGLSQLWQPGNLILVQAIGLYVFFKTGKSTVTAAKLRLRLSRNF